MSIASSKASIVRDLFVRTADENYITARWCAANGLNTDFLWLALHALEKYLKAVLLLNGQSSKRQDGHNIVELYNDVKSIGNSLLPTTLIRPLNLDINDWRDLSTDDFIAKIMRNGNAQNRYLIHGYIKESEDIHMLDAMVFAIRRLICPLEDRVFPSLNAADFTYRELLERQPDYYGRMGMPLDKLIETNESSDSKTAALNLNLAFAPNDFPHTSMRSGFCMRNPVIDYRILEKLQSENRNTAKESIEIANWFIENIKTGRDVESEIKNAVEAANSRHKIS